MGIPRRQNWWINVQLASRGRFGVVSSEGLEMIGEGVTIQLALIMDG